MNDEIKVSWEQLRSNLPPPVAARHHELSMVFSSDDDPGQPTPDLIRLALRAIELAPKTGLEDVSRRMPKRPYWTDIWPGEHYRLLAALVLVVRPRLVVEIGTETGLSALSLLKYLPEDGRLVTFDLLPWRSHPSGTVLTESDFADGRLSQMIGDLSDPVTFELHRDLLSNANLIFCDGPKDGAFEAAFLREIQTLRFNPGAILVLDDIKLWNMLSTWRQISQPKLDITSFGHWSGTGLVLI